MQVVTDPDGRLLWLSPALPGRAHDPTSPSPYPPDRPHLRPVERGVARLKFWRIFRRSRCGPNPMMSIAKAVLALERQR